MLDYQRQGAVKEKMHGFELLYLGMNEGVFRRKVIN